MFPQRNINKFTWTSDGKTHSQVDNILRRNSVVLDVRSFRAADYDTHPLSGGGKS
jgi:hypothetical protein